MDDLETGWLRHPSPFDPGSPWAFRNPGVSDDSMMLYWWMYRGAYGVEPFYWGAGYRPQDEEYHKPPPRPPAPPRPTFIIDENQLLFSPEPKIEDGTPVFPKDDEPLPPNVLDTPYYGY